MTVQAKYAWTSDQPCPSGTRQYTFKLAHKAKPGAVMVAAPGFAQDLVSRPMSNPEKGGDHLSSPSTQPNPARASDRRFGR